MAAKANDASAAAQAQEDDATAAQENVVNSLQKAYSEAEDAEKANRAADEAKREAHEASNLAQIAQNANATANSHKLFQHVNSASDKVARKASEARVENERLKKQETLVTEDMSRMQSLNQSLSVPGMSNSSDKQFLVQQIQEANATLSADQTKLKTLKS